MTEGAPPTQDVVTIARWLAESRHVAAFPGAGISTDSGIGDVLPPAVELSGSSRARRWQTDSRISYASRHTLFLRSRGSE